MTGNLINRLTGLKSQQSLIGFGMGLLLMWLSALAQSAPYSGNEMEFVQPDGSTVVAKLYGDEFYLRAESLDGFTLIRDEKSGWLSYANLASDGLNLVSTGIPYTGQHSLKSTSKSVTHLQPGIRLSADAIQRLRDANRNALGLQLGGKSTGEIRSSRSEFNAANANQVTGLSILIDFSDAPAVHGKSEIENMLNSNNYTNFGNNGSLKQYFSDISGGIYTYENEVFGYYRAPKTFAHYDSLNYGQGAQELLHETLDWITNTLNFDLNNVTLNGSNQILAINLMYTGSPQAWAQGMWYHQGYYSGFSHQGISSGAYNTSPVNSNLSIGVIAHENGHMLFGWPDTYKYSNSSGVPDGIGAFDLMSWYGSGTNPVPPNPYFMSLEGWTNVQEIQSLDGTINAYYNALDIFKMPNPNNAQEYYLIQARKKEGRSTFIPDNGLTVWHVDEGGDNQSNRHEIYLVHADNDISSHGGAPFTLSGNKMFTVYSTPNSHWYSGLPVGNDLGDSGLNIEVASDVQGGDSMQVTFWPHQVWTLDSHYPQYSNGRYQLTSEYNGYPVYQHESSGWLIYRRGNGQWFLDFDSASEDWSGTLAWTTSAADQPWYQQWSTGTLTQNNDVFAKDAPYPQYSDGQFVFSGAYDGYPVFTHQTSGWKIYRRGNGSWFMDFNAVSEDWDGTVAYTSSASAMPWVTDWSSGAVVSSSSLMMTNAHYPYASTGEYQLDSVYNGAAVYRHTVSGWIIYRRANGHWYLDFNEASEDWDGTLSWTYSLASEPWGNRWTSGVVSKFD